MKFKLHKIAQLSGSKASVYTVTLDGDAGSLFEQFLIANKGEFPAETQDLLLALRTIGHKTGARVDFFKKGEGRMGDHISALFDVPERKLRLYCIQFGMDCIILGGGGPKTTRTWQEDTELSRQMHLLMQVADRIHQGFADKELGWGPGMRDITGDLDFKEYDDDQEF
ncbi:hypothetical protein GCM10027037_00340 [Mucilaginibacter koreensis]